MNDVRRKVIREGLRLSRPEHALDCVYEVIQKCQNDDPLGRPTFSELTGCFQKIEDDYKIGKLHNSFCYTEMKDFENGEEIWLSFVVLSNSSYVFFS